MSPLANLASAFVLSAVVVPGPEPAELVHRMPAGRTLEITLRQSETSSMQSQVWHPVEDGEVVTDQENDFDTRYEPSFETEIVLVDRYGDVDDDGRLLSLERTFESVEATHEWVWEAGSDEDSGEDEWTTPLAGHAVTFEWNEDDGEYDASFGDDDEPESGFDEALLAGMRVDAFGDWYLPPEDEAEVEVGDSWDAGVDAWHRTIDIGGDFWIGGEREEPPTDDEIDGRRSMRGQLRSGGVGEVICTFRGLEAADDVQLAIVDIEIEIEVEAELETESEEEGTTDVETAMVVEGTGRMLWDVAAGLPRSLEFEMTWTTNESVVTYGDDGDGDSWSTVMETESTIEYAFRVTD